MSVDAAGRRRLTRAQVRALKQAAGCLESCRLSGRGKQVDGVWVDLYGRHNGQTFSVDGHITALRRFWDRDHERLRAEGR